MPYGSKAWQLHPALAYEPTDRLIRKHANSFFQTDLQAVLRQNQVRSIEFAGAQTEYCLDGTIKFTHGLGYIKTSCMPKPQRRIQAEDDQQLKSLIGTK